MTDTQSVIINNVQIARYSPNMTLSTSQSSLEEDAEFVNHSKARFRRRLRDRWCCQIPGHTHCFTNLDGAHVSLSAETVEVWASAMHNGEATLLIAPKSVFESSTYRPDSDSHSIQYNRSLRWRQNRSLTDFQCMRAGLHTSIASSSGSDQSTSTVLSVPGIGYLSGKAVKWVGLQMLNAVEPLVIFRRRRAISDLIKRFKDVHQQDRAKWMFKRERKINRTVEDLLELTKEQYKAQYRTKAIAQGDLLRDLFLESIRIFGSKESTYLISTSVKLFPIFLLSNDSFALEDFACDLIETLLQDPLEVCDEKYPTAEIAAQLCFELAHGTPSAPWRVEGYTTIFSMYGTTYSQIMRNLGKDGLLIDNLATTTFSNAAQMSISEHSGAILFFARYANDVPKYRIHLLSPTGIPLSVKHIKSLHTTIDDTSLWYLSRVFAWASDYDWCVAMLVECDICPILANLVIFTQRQLRDTTSRAAYRLVRTLQNLAVHGGDSGRQAVLDATTDDLRQVFPHVIKGVRRFMGDKFAALTEGWIAETWQ